MRTERDRDQAQRPQSDLNRPDLPPNVNSEVISVIIHKAVGILLTKRRDSPK